MTEPKRIPLWGKDTDGRTTIVRGYALVDAADFDDLDRFSWHLSDRGYARRSVRTPEGKVRTVRMARQIMGLDFGDSEEVDHINRDKLDNQRSNLRLTDRTGNNRNRAPWGKKAREYAPA